jgi:D-alanine-D-alanine ligase
VEISHNTDNIISRPSFGRVAVLLGGSSAEREISLLSGEAIYQALKAKNIDVIKLDTKHDELSKLKEANISRVFIALHGRDGEDGVVQGYLRMLGIPFTGSDLASSALAMNKLNSKRIWLSLGYSTAPFEKVSRKFNYNEALAEVAINKLGTQLFVKPIREGSSVGMSKVDSIEGLVKAVKLAQQYDDVLIEKFINGQEYTVSIIDDKALPSIRMVTPNEFYDYDAKYCSDKTEYFCPSGLNELQEKQLRVQALSAFKALGCSGWGRVDFIQDTANQDFMLLEANTVPGMTKNSLVPKAAAQAGIEFDDLVLKILATSFDSKDNTAEGNHG